MKISFAICTHNETYSLKSLLDRLLEYVSLDKSGVSYEIIILDDHSTDQQTIEILNKYKSIQSKCDVHVYHRRLNNNYSDQKNYLNSLCSGDWILNLDADELVSLDFLNMLWQIVDTNPYIQAYWIPRINIVDGITLRHVREWSWVLTKMEEFRQLSYMETTSEEYKLLDEYKFIISQENNHVIHYRPIVMFPDYQMRFYKRSENILWKNKVHEQLTGYLTFSFFPTDVDSCILHIKNIARQEKQNQFYNELLQ